MSPEHALLTLLSAVVVILCLASVGLLGRIRILEDAVSKRGRAVKPQQELATSVLMPTGTAAISVTLLVDKGCRVCADALEQFELAARDDDKGNVDYIVLTDHDLLMESRSERPRRILDVVSHASLHPGWTPALVMVDREEGLLRIEPAGSEAAITGVLERARDWRQTAQ